MFRYIVRRILQMIPVLIGTTFIIFCLVFALPGDPTAGRCGERPCPPAYVAAFRAEYNLDKPLLVQYGLYLEKLLHGNLGVDYYGNTVVSELGARYPVTIKLAVPPCSLRSSSASSPACGRACSAARSSTTSS